jgi:hypothetical protein
MRELRDPAHWNATPARRTDALPARPRWSPLVVTMATIAAVAVVMVIVFSAVGGSIRGLRQPAVPPAPTSSSSPTPSAIAPTPTSSPVPVTYAGSATCSNLLDDSTLEGFRAKGWVDVSAEYIAHHSLDPKWSLRNFLDSDGLVCAWGPAGATGEDTVAYGYGPLTAAQKDQYENASGNLSFTTLHNVDYIGPGINDISQGAYAFGPDVWAASFDTGEGQVLNELVTNGPGFPKQSTQSAVYATSEGIGDIRVGQRLSSSRLVAWNPTACGNKKPEPTQPWTGAWLATKPFDYTTLGHRAIDVVTSNGLRNGTVDLIWISSSDIPTKSGIRVGDTESTLKKKFPGIALTKPSGDARTYILTGSAGEILFDVAYASYGGDPRTPEPEIITMRIIPKGSPIPGWGGDSGGSCKG